MIEGYAQAPDKKIRDSGEEFFTKRFGAGIKRAVVLAEAEVGGIGFGEPGAVGAGACIDATGGNVPPGDGGGGTRFGYAARKHGVAEEAVGFVGFAGVDVGFTGVTRRVDQEADVIGAEGGGQGGRVGVVELGPGDALEGEAFGGEERLIGLAHVAGTAEEVDHE